MSADGTLRGFGSLLFIGILWAVGVSAYEQLDSEGWISHKGESVITAEANWFVGESKDCISYPLSAEAASSVHKDVGNATYSIDCDHGPEHRMKLTFYGKSERPDVAAVEWRCTRTQDSFECRQTGAVAARTPEVAHETPNPPADVGISKSAAKILCEGSADHKIHYTEVLRYAELRKIPATDAAQELQTAGCGIVQ